MEEDSENTRPAEVKELLASYEETFKNRYTLEDEVFKKYLDTPLPDPPVVENWYQRPKRNDRGDDRGRRGGWDNRRRDDRYRGNQDRYGDNRGGSGYGQHRDRDNRHRGDRGQHGGWKDNRRDDRHHPYQRDQRQSYDRRQDRSGDRRSQRDNSKGGRNWEDY